MSRAPAIFSLKTWVSPPNSVWVRVAFERRRRAMMVMGMAAKG